MALLVAGWYRWFSSTPPVDTLRITGSCFGGCHHYIMVVNNNGCVYVCTYARSVMLCSFSGLLHSPQHWMYWICDHFSSRSPSTFGGVQAGPDNRHMTGPVNRHMTGPSGIPRNMGTPASHNIALRSLAKVGSEICRIEGFTWFSAGFQHFSPGKKPSRSLGWSQTGCWLAPTAEVKRRLRP